MFPHSPEAEMDPFGRREAENEAFCASGCGCLVQTAHQQVPQMPLWTTGLEGKM